MPISVGGNRLFWTPRIWECLQAFVESQGYIEARGCDPIEDGILSFDLLLELCERQLAFGAECMPDCTLSFAKSLPCFEINNLSLHNSSVVGYNSSLCSGLYD